MEEHLIESMDEGFHSSLVNMLSECMCRLEAVKHSEDPHKGTVGGRGCMEAGRGGGAEDGSHSRGEIQMEEDVIEAEKKVSADEEKVWKRRVVESLRKLTLYYSDRVTAWREVVRKCECSTYKWPLERSNHQHPTLGMCTSQLLYYCTNISSFNGRYHLIFCVCVF